MRVGAIRAYPHFDVYISKSLQDFIFIEIIRLKHRAVLHKERRTVAFLTALRAAALFEYLRRCTRSCLLKIEQ